MKTNILKKWIILGVLEGLLSLVLISVAPIFLNSDRPWIGFLIWLGVIGLLVSSVLYVIYRLIDAHRARKLFVSSFPEYHYLGTLDFLGFSHAHVAKNLNTFLAAQADPDFQSLQISPLDLLRGAQHK